MRSHLAFLMRPVSSEAIEVRGAAAGTRGVCGTHTCEAPASCFVCVCVVAEICTCCSVCSLIRAAPIISESPQPGSLSVASPLTSASPRLPPCITAAGPRRRLGVHGAPAEARGRAVPRGRAGGRPLPPRLRCTRRQVGGRRQRHRRLPQPAAHQPAGGAAQRGRAPGGGRPLRLPVPPLLAHAPLRGALRAAPPRVCWHPRAAGPCRRVGVQVRPVAGAGLGGGGLAGGWGGKPGMHAGTAWCAHAGLVR